MSWQVKKHILMMDLVISLLTIGCHQMFHRIYHISLIRDAMVTIYFSYHTHLIIITQLKISSVHIIVFIMQTHKRATEIRVLELMLSAFIGRKNAGVACPLS